jgi:hypothetical protein
MNINTSFLFDDKDERSLEKNHTHFLLLDDGKYQSSFLNNETNEQFRVLFNPQSPSPSPAPIQNYQRGSIRLILKICFCYFSSNYFRRKFK